MNPQSPGSPLSELDSRDTFWSKATAMLIVYDVLILPYLMERVPPVDLVEQQVAPRPPKAASVDEIGSSYTPDPALTTLS